MPRWIASLLAAFVAAMPLLALDKSADEKGNDRATQFKQIQADYQKAVPGAREALKAAKTEAEREAVFDKLSKRFSPRILKLAEAEPKDKLSFEMLLWSLQSLPNVDSKVFERLAKDWAKDKKIKQVCQFLMFAPKEEANELLENVLHQNSDKEAQGFACFALAKMHKDQSESQGDVKAAEKAEKLLERVGKEFAELTVAGDTLGEQAKDSLADIRVRGVGKKMPNLESNNLRGKKVQLKDYKGKVVVLDIWATWCPPCRAMIPHEREMTEKLKDKPFALISVSADADKEDLEKFLESNEMPWTHWWNGAKGGILKELEIKFFPTIYVLDGQGVIRYKNIRNKDLEKAVVKLLAEAKDKK
ncbi:MAG TPA: TlpA disulfide reductase family protein [Gemmataceae bacterium]|nr:TlpA disulfide reductase family protein [Gemmataceae bacterium]